MTPCIFSLGSRLKVSGHLQTPVALTPMKQPHLVGLLLAGLVPQFPDLLVPVPADVFQLHTCSLDCY